ncbi:uncharacterized protein TEOVI_000564200 [Trypanosoma equiperdum]|uniref:Uncharacterized protein n=2 Tax=Trypanozoon TaxID=39700 RepID=Q585Z6_TRYB2|nr:hypothetical protein, conserved [Trypanosoma brucei brucei TREU927]AAX80758.1 hypothetical protein, conserved [Trypanosoma brucei]AAZ11957.1 hypothetical protein, conserved [Trypanosoma brucei brucei TREU927]SCU67510.1 hypothetical protein, conserved [Trypanosoma equiperdum]
MIIDHERRAIDFSDNTTFVLDSNVLQRLRDAICSNDFYCNLVFDHNTFTDDAIGILAAILKGSNPIESLSLRSCSLKDLDIIHLAHAICTRKCLVHLDLSKNPGITSASSPEIGRIIQGVPTIKSIHLVGTGILEKNSSHLISALEGCFSLQVLELPFSVGYRVLDRTRELLKKNKTLSDVSDGLPEKAGRILMSQDSSEVGFFRQIRSHARSLKPQIIPSLATSDTESKRASNGYLASFPHLQQWVDPALMNAAMYIKVLDKRCNMLDEHLSEKRNRILARRGQTR